MIHDYLKKMEAELEESDPYTTIERYMKCEECKYLKEKKRVFKESCIPILWNSDCGTRKISA
jgi:hypothetical protein